MRHSITPTDRCVLGPGAGALRPLDGIPARSLQVADQIARDDIRRYCTARADSSGRTWYDTRVVEGYPACGLVECAVAHLVLRGQLRLGSQHSDEVSFGDPQ